MLHSLRFLFPIIALVLCCWDSIRTVSANASFSEFADASEVPKCPESPLAHSESEWNGWGAGAENLRFQPNPGFTASQITRFRLKWAFGFPGDTHAFAQPALIGGRLFIGSAGGVVYSLDAKNGCTYWNFKAEATVRTAVSVSEPNPGGKRLVFFGDQQARVYAVDAITGTKVWSAKLESFPSAVITGAPLLTHGKLFVPVSSIEEVTANNAKYECCRFRGSVVALDPASGQQIWKTYTVVEEAHPSGHTSSGVQKWGPSGAGVWSTPTYDERTRLLYIGTGDSYSEPAASTSDSVLAIEATTGAVRWVRQLTAGDAFTTGCLATPKVNCPEPAGPDFDIGSSPVLVSLASGRRVLVVGQKSGIVYGLDPDHEGGVLWQTRVGEGGHLGGVQWGLASDGKNVYVATADRRFVVGPSGDDRAHRTLDPTKGGGLRSINVDNGDVIWEAKPPNACKERTNCSPAQSAAVSVMNGLVFSSALDGHIRAYDANNGAVVWDFDTVRPFTTLNKVEAHGGSIDAAGTVFAGGMLFATSGYGRFGGAPGNVLLAFSVDGN